MALGTLGLFESLLTAITAGRSISIFESLSLPNPLPILTLFSGNPPHPPLIKGEGGLPITKVACSTLNISANLGPISSIESSSAEFPADNQIKIAVLFNCKA